MEQSHADTYNLPFCLSKDFLTATTELFILSSFSTEIPFLADNHFSWPVPTLSIWVYEAPQGQQIPFVAKSSAASAFSQNTTFSRKRFPSRSSKILMSPSPNRQPFNILPLANASNPLHHCMFKHESSTNNTDGTEPPSVRWAMTQMSAADPSGEPRTYVLKAEPEGEVTAVGFAIVKVFEREGDEEKEESTWQEEGNTNDPEATERCKEPPGHETKSDLEVNDDTLEPAFCGVYLGKLNDVYERHMAGKRHACKSFTFPPFM